MTSKATGRKLRFLGDGEHGERSLETGSKNYDIEISPLDLANGYRQTYLVGVYSDPDAAPDETSMTIEAPSTACPCGTVGL